MAALADRLKSDAARLAQALDLTPREARLETQMLAARALNVDRTWLIAHDRDEISAPQLAALESLVCRREHGEPVAYILGEREFYGRRFTVTPDVLIPRPETELLVEAALARLALSPSARLLDLGTGSGCLAVTLALECPACTVWAVDKSPAALAVAQGNALHWMAKVQFMESDWFDNLADETFDLIVSNPPYVASVAPELNSGDVRFEPQSALTAGVSGLDDLQRIAAEAPRHLRPGGWLMMEHGWDQGVACRELLHTQGFFHVETLQDLAGHDRVTLGRQPE